jgi:hypothetical protein
VSLTTTEGALMKGSLFDVSSDLLICFLGLGFRISGMGSSLGTGDTFGGCGGFD